MQEDADKVSMREKFDFHDWFSEMAEMSAISTHQKIQSL